MDIASLSFLEEDTFVKKILEQNSSYSDLYDLLSFSPFEIL